MKISDTSLLHRKLNMSSWSCVNFNAKSKKYSVITFEMIGKSIKSLVDMFYEHKFCKHPFVNLSPELTHKVLEETVKIENYLKLLEIFFY